jgi:hypothetical protein
MIFGEVYKKIVWLCFSKKNKKTKTKSKLQGVGPSGGGLDLMVCSFSSFKVQYLIGVNNLLGQHLLLKS